MGVFLICVTRCCFLFPREEAAVFQHGTYKYSEARRGWATGRRRGWLVLY